MASKPSLLKMSCTLPATCRGARKSRTCELGGSVTGCTRTCASPFRGRSRWGRVTKSRRPYATNSCTTCRIWAAQPFTSIPMGRAGTVTIASERTCMMGCRCTRTNRPGQPDLGLSLYLTWVLLSAGLVLAPPPSALAQASRPDDELAEARRLNQEAAALYSSGKFPEAIPLVQRALAIQEKALGPEHADVGASLDALAGLYRAQGQYRDAERLYRRALAIREKTLGRANPALALSLNNLAGLYRAQGKYAQAEPLYRRALVIEEESRGPEALVVAPSLDNLAGLYRAQGKYAQAEPLYRRGPSIREKRRGAGGPGDAARAGNN